MTSTRLCVWMVCITGCAGATLCADPIPGIYGTGVGDDGSALGDGRADPHYALISSPDPAYPGPAAYTINSNSFMIQSDSVWNTTLSRWIGPRADAMGNVPGGFCEQQFPKLDCHNAHYVYQTTFNLTGLDHASAVIRGRWAIDDSGEMVLNGVNTGVRRSYVYGTTANFRTWADFTLSKGFIPGLNTLTIDTVNRFFPLNQDENGTALHVEILSATADPDTCPDDPLKGNPGQCGCGRPDTDTDGDGVADCADKCPNDPHKTVFGACGCGTPDNDSDHDGVPNCADDCPVDPGKTAPGLCGCGAPDVPGCPDACPANPNKTHPGVCGCDVQEQDADNDGVIDCLEGCPNDPNKTRPGDCGCGTPDVDSDGDGIADCDDACPNDPDKIAPGQCGCGASDNDFDGDGAADCVDLCPRQPWKITPGLCGCRVPVDSTVDADGDGIPDCVPEGLKDYLPHRRFARLRKRHLLVGVVAAAFVAAGLGLYRRHRRSRT